VGGYFQPRTIAGAGGSLDKSQGNHALNFGMEFRANQLNSYSNTATTPTLAFGTSWTQGPLDNSAASPIGQGLASMLFGLPTSGSISTVPTYAEESTRWSFYGQDTWKVTRKLVLTLGLRYENEGPLSERYNRADRGFDPSAALAIGSQVQANYAKNPTPEIPAGQFPVTGGVTFPGVGGQPRTLFNRDNGDVMPRLGVAYNPWTRTVIRAGYGVSYGTLGVERMDIINSSGFVQTTQVVPSLDNGLTFGGTLANPFPNGIQPAVGSSLGPNTNLGNAISVFDTNPKAPRAQKWELNLQHELPGRTVLSVAYAGMHGSQLQVTRNLDALPISISVQVLRAIRLPSII
jgi:hypothetical protein